MAPGSLSEAGEFQSWMVSGGGGSGDGMRERSRSRDDPPGAPAVPPDDAYAEQVEEEEDQAEDEPVDDDSGFNWTLCRPASPIVFCGERPLCDGLSVQEHAARHWLQEDHPGLRQGGATQTRVSAHQIEPHGHRVCPARH